MKISDFGIAHAGSRPTAVASGSSARAKGKLGYLAPEQVEGHEADAQTDIFSAAVVGAELLLGRPLFQGSSELAILLAIRDGRVEALQALAGRVDTRVVDALLSALHVDRSARPLSADALGLALRPFAASPDDARERLGLLVSSARAETQLTDSAAPTPTRERAVMWAAVSGTEATPVVEADSGPTTAEIDVESYEVIQANGRPLGQLTYAKLVEAIATGQIGAFDLVGLGKTPPRPLYLLGELARHLPPSSATTMTTDAEAPRRPDRAGPIAYGGFVRTMGELLLARETGLLLCEREAARKEIYVRDGAPVFVTSNLQSELLGEYLIGKGAITRDELDMALAVMPRFEGKLGDTLVGLSLVEPVDLFQHIANQVREKLFDVFTWDEGELTFYRGVPGPQSRFPLGSSPWELLDAGMKQRVAAGRERATFHAHLLDELENDTQGLAATDAETLPPRLRRVLTLTERPIALQTVIETLERPEDTGRGYRWVALLLHLGLLRWRP